MSVLSRELSCSGSLLCSQGRFIIRVQAVVSAVDTHLRKCQAPNSFWAGRCRGARMWLGTWCPGTFTVPTAPSSQQHLVLEVPQLKTGEASRRKRAGEPQAWALSRCGGQGPGRRRASRLREAVAAGERAWGDPGAHSQCARHALQGNGVRPAEGQGGAGRGSGARPGRASEAGLRSLCAGTHGGSFWLLVGLVGAEGTAGLEVGWGLTRPRGWWKGGQLQGALRGGARTGSQTSGRRSQDES